MNILFVSLGPGDPELITLKGLRALEGCDHIFCPTIKTKAGREISRARDIVLELGIDSSKIELYNLPMSRDRAAALQNYREVSEKAIELFDRGVKVVITAEGDGGFFSSSQYINDMLIAKGYPTKRISGVPAFIDCGTLANIPVVKGDCRLEVIPYVTDIKELEDSLRGDKNVVLMKVSQMESLLKEVMVSNNTHTFHYFENCGFSDLEFYTNRKEEIVNRDFPYFSILIITKKEE